MVQDFRGNLEPSNREFVDEKLHNVFWRPGKSSPEIRGIARIAQNRTLFTPNAY